MTGIASTILDEAVQHLLRRKRGEGPTVACEHVLALHHGALLPEQVAEACARARGLLVAAFDVANDFRDERIDLGEATARLEREHPGFGEASYSAALGWGMFESR